MGANSRIQLVRLLRPHKRPLQLDRHLLDGARPEPAPLRRHQLGRLVLADFLLLDVRAHGQDGELVCVVEVVFQVELVEVEWDEEGGHRCGEVGRAQEGDGEAGAVGEGGGWVSGLSVGGGW